MGRPKPIAELLANSKKHDRVLSEGNDEPDEYSEIQSLRKVRKIMHGDVNTNPFNHSKEGKISKKTRSRFQFDWDLQREDTTKTYEPITQFDARQLLGQKDRDLLENAYMGKHWSEKRLAEMKPRDWRILETDYNITTRTASAKPLRFWQDDNNLIPARILDILVETLHYREPTPIQRIAIPNIMNKRKFRDFMGVASTGSGKTLAFGIPILARFYEAGQLRPISIKKLDGPLALILAPTRELAQQIFQVINELSSFLYPNKEFAVSSVVGGHSLQEISLNIKDGVDILIATPGKLLEVVDNHMLVISHVETLVLDEADRMIDLGFEEQLTDILAYVHKMRIGSHLRTLMFTATMTPSIEKIANTYLVDPVYAQVNSQDSSEDMPKICQKLQYISKDDEKLKELIRLLNQYEPPCIVFINYKESAYWLTERLSNELPHLKIVTIHGSKTQEHRELSLKQLRTGKAQVLIATNVAARGIDIPNVSLVVNFQVSKNFDDYVHRIGRTARAGKHGTAISFIGDSDDKRLVEKLFKFVQKRNPLQNNFVSTELKKKFDLVDTQQNIII